LALTVGVCLLLIASQRQIAGPLHAWTVAQIASMFPARPWTAMDIVVIAASIAVVTLATTVVHEAGHAVGGIAAGLRFRRLRVGPLQLDDRFRVSRYRGRGAWFGGAAALVPVNAHHLRPRAVAMILGGSAANALSAWLCGWLAAPADPLLRLFIGGSVVAALLNLLPCRFGSLTLDGWYLMKVLKRGWAERWLALIRLDAEVSAGTPQESWPAEFLVKATDFRDHSDDTVRAHGLAHAALDAQGEWDAAARALEVCLRQCHLVPLLHRDALIGDAAVFQGRRRGRADIAERWLADLSESPAFPAVRARAEAAVLQAHGDRHGALEKLREVESSLQAIPNDSLREATLREVRKWVGDLSEATS
jgi:hypothetical protein